MSDSNRIAVVGATGRVGHHLVDVLAELGYEVVRISRADGVDVISGEGLRPALQGVGCIVDAATGPSPEEQAATRFFATAAANLQAEGARAGVGGIIVVSIINTDRMQGGYAIAKVAHERATLAGPIPARVVRAAQFHEFVEQLVQWGVQGDVANVPRMRTQLVAARTVAEALADVAGDPSAVPGPTLEVAGPREENLAEMARLLVAHRDLPLRVEEIDDPVEAEGYEAGVALPGPGARLGGPTFEEWLRTS